jgi:dethiobiotin synthetase
VNFFITGTDTGVGKTHFTALLTRALRRAGFDTVALKPVCCGPRDDAEALWEASGRRLSLDDINPVWLDAPAAPLAAARQSGRAVDLPTLEQWFAPLRAGHRSLLVEGAGGWLVPLADRLTMADLAARLRLPVLVVVANKLGCLNHTLLTVESARARGLECAGLVLNTMTDDASLAVETNASLLEEFTGLPILFRLAPGQTDLELAVA